MDAKIVLLMLVSLAFAGCAGDNDVQSTPPVEVEEEDLKSGKGGLRGLVVDDAFRPIPAAEIYLLPLGLETISTPDGEFAFVDLDPGDYELLAQASGHEAIKTPVRVVEGEFTEQHLEARRIVNQEGTIIVNEYSVFIPCAVDFVANFIVGDCGIDSSGDSARYGFNTNVTSHGDNITYIVTEMKAANVGDYNIQVREDDGSDAGGKRYVVADIYDTDYVKMIMEYNVTNTEHNDQNNNNPWINEGTYDTILFYVGEYKQEVQSAAQNWPGNPGAPIWLNAPICCGAGAQFGIRAQFYQSIFLGEPDVDIDTYRLIEA